VIRTLAGHASGAPQVGNARRSALLLLFPLTACYYAFLLTAAGNNGLFAPMPYGLTFNSMLLHLLHGRFDVDPAAIGREGYLRDGAIYAYFGVFPALLRAPLLGLRDFATTDFTRLSCLLAVSVMASFKMLSAGLVWRSAGGRDALLLPLLVAAILLGGPQIQFLWPSIFVESVLWSGAWTAVFIYLVLRGWTGREGGFTAGLLCALALVAGLCLLTRVSTALGLYVAFALIWLWRCAGEIRGRPIAPKRLVVLAMPVAVAAAFAAATGFVNHQRWGNPLLFVDLTRALMMVEFPERLERLQQYGALNPIRLGFGLIYYFLPVWMLRDGSGQLWWAEFVKRTMDSAELPPSTFLISDPLLIGLAIYGVLGLIRRIVPGPMPVVLTAAGLLIPIGLMLIAIHMTFRYRMEFYPLFEVLAFIGFWRLSANGPRPAATTFVAAGAAASIIAAHAMWLLYAMSPFGPADKFLGGRSVVEFYGSLLH
jgi:hypothetical protein